MASIWIIILATVIAYLARRFLFETYWQIPVPQNGAILITGTSTGVGKDLAFHFAKRGFLVFATVRKTEDAQRLHNECPQNKNLLKTVIMDTTKDDQVRDAVETVRSELKQANKQLFSVICNAGYAESFPIETTTQGDYDKIFGANVYGTISTVKSFVPLLREYTGEGSPRIVITSSLAGYLSTHGLGVYCASKHALEALADALMFELRYWNIKVSVIQPGTFDSPMITDIQNGPKYETEQYNQMISNFRKTFGSMLKMLGMKDLTPLVSAFDKVVLAKYPPARRSVGIDVDTNYLVSCLPDSGIYYTWVMLDALASKFL